MVVSALKACFSFLLQRITDLLNNFNFQECTFCFLCTCVCGAAKYLSTVLSLSSVLCYCHWWGKEFVLSVVLTSAQFTVNQRWNMNNVYGTRSVWVVLKMFWYIPSYQLNIFVSPLKNFLHHCYTTEYSYFLNTNINTFCFWCAFKNLKWNVLFTSTVVSC